MILYIDTYEQNLAPRPWYFCILIPVEVGGEKFMQRIEIYGLWIFLLWLILKKLKCDTS
jgi:hypothetical protein